MADLIRKGSSTGSEEIDLLLSFQEDLTSIYCTPSRYVISPGDTVFEYDYLDNEDHAYYTNAWLEHKNYDMMVGYDDFYTNSWIRYAKEELKKWTPVKRLIKYSRSEFMDIFKKVMNTSCPPLFSAHEVTSQIIYQPIRQPKNPVDNNISGFTPAAVVYSICPDCLSKRRV